MWKSSRSEPVLRIRTWRKIPAAGVQDPLNPPFDADVSHSCFFRRDKFILLSSGKRLAMYKYSLDVHPDNDAKR